MSEGKGEFEAAHIPDGMGAIRELQQALAQRDKAAIRDVLEKIQRLIHGDSKIKWITPPRDGDVEELLRTGSTTIYVGTGTAGHRAFIEGNRLFMSENEDSDRYGARFFRDNFRKAFGIAEGGELEVFFSSEQGQEGNRKED
ncbi:MAG: hypothetical protein V1907_02135 [Candidatus Kerfeldbacteria bacterium]